MNSFNRLVALLRADNLGHFGVFDDIVMTVFAALVSGVVRDFEGVFLSFGGEHEFFPFADYLIFYEGGDTGRFIRLCRKWFRRSSLNSF